MSNPFIPADDFISGLKLEYNFTNKSNGSNTLTGECNACLTSGILYDLYLHDIDYNGNNNASLISKIKSNIEYIHISSTNFDGVLFNASHISYESNITKFNASLSASSTQSFPVGPAIVDFVLIRNIHGIPGGSDNQIQYNNGGSFGASSNLTFDGTLLNLSGSLTVSGNLHINGSTTTVYTENTRIKDQLIELNACNTSASYSGILINGDNASNVFMGWKSDIESFIFGKTNDNASSTNITITYTNITGANASFTNGSFTNLDVSGSLTGVSLDDISDCLVNASSVYVGNNPNASSVAKNNTGVGINVLNSITIGEDNTAIGYNALTTITNSNYNTAIGTMALKYNTSVSNTAIGRKSLSLNTTGENNTAVGKDSLKKNETGSRNVALGYQSGSMIYSGNNNIIIGSDANPSASNTSNEIVIGTGAIGHGENIVVIGNSDVVAWHPADDGGVDLGDPSYKFKDLYINGNASITSGSFTSLTVNGISVTGGGGSGTPSGSNTQIQYNASGSFEGSASLVFYSGSSTLAVNGSITATNKISGNNASFSSGSFTTISGHLTGDASGINASFSNGSFTKISGNNASFSSGSFTKIYGDNASFINISGDNASFTNGSFTKINNISIYRNNNNLIIGDIPGGIKTNGSYNTSIGLGASASLTGGYENVSVGYKSLYNASNASGNVAIGYKAGYHHTGSNNIFIGHNSGVRNITNASNIEDSKSSNQIYIGSNASFTIHDDGSVTSGPLIYGNSNNNGYLQFNASKVLFNASFIDIEGGLLQIHHSTLQLDTASIGDDNHINIGYYEGGSGSYVRLYTSKADKDTVSYETEDVDGYVDFRVKTLIGSSASCTSGSFTTLQVDNISIDGNTISSTDSTDFNITPLTGQKIVLDGAINIDAGVVTGATSITSTAFVGALTGNVSGTAATVTGAAQTAITSVGTLTALQVDNINISSNTISSTAGTDLNITPLTGHQIVLDGTIIIYAGVVTGATSITSTAFVGNLTGNASGTSGSFTNLDVSGSLTVGGVDVAGGGGGGGTPGGNNTEIQYNDNGAFNGSSSLVFYNGSSTLAVNGSITATGDITAFYASSDKRLKKNIVTIENPLDIINNIRGVRFNWNDEAKKVNPGVDLNKIEMGVIAQEIEDHIPEVIKGGLQGYKAVRYEKIVPLLIETIKEQQKQINNLNDRLEKLENKVN